MDELLEGLEIIFEAYPEYLGSLYYAMKSWPWLLLAYALIVLPLAGCIVYLLGRWKPKFLRTFFQSLVVAIAILPGAYGDGGLLFLPLAGVLAGAIALMEPALLLYNVGLLVAALSIALVAAAVVHPWVVGRFSHAT